MENKRHFPIIWRDRTFSKKIYDIFFNLIGLLLVSYWINIMERVMGIEPTWSAWKAEVLPLNYTRKIVAAIRHEKNFIMVLYYIVLL